MAVFLTRAPSFYHIWKPLYKVKGISVLYSVEHVILQGTDLIFECPFAGMMKVSKVIITLILQVWPLLSYLKSILKTNIRIFFFDILHLWIIWLIYITLLFGIFFFFILIFVIIEYFFVVSSNLFLKLT